MMDKILNSLAAVTRLLFKLGFNLLLFPLRIFKVKGNRIVLLNSLSGNYSCNPKYIAEYVVEHYPGKYEIIFPLKKIDDEQFRELNDKGLKTVVIGTALYYYYVMTCGFFITNSGGISYIPFRKKQIVINTWHGGGAYKMAGIDAEKSLFYRLDCKMTAKRITYFIASSGKFKEVISKALLIDERKFLNIGLPRNDIFFANYSNTISKLKKEYHLEDDIKIVLYAPTYRTPDAGTFFQHQIGPYEIDYSRVIDSLAKKFGGKWVFAVRLHSSIASDITQFPENVINMSDYADSQEVLCSADILINDYSSIMWDYVQTGKPCFIFATDYQKYLDTIGLYTYADSWPFPFAQDNEALIDNIMNFDYNAYTNAVEEYFNWMHNYELGQACLKLCEKIGLS